MHARPTAGKALAPKTPSNFQTPHTTNRAPLGAKTTNAKAQTVFRDKENAKLQPFKTPAPGQQRTRPERSANRPSTTQRSGRSKINIAPLEPVQANVLTQNTEDDEPDFGYAPPPIVELPDPPIEFNYDQDFPQFRSENMFRGYGEIYLGSPKDENGMSLRLKKEEQEYNEYQQQQEREYMKRMQEKMSKPLFDSDDEFDRPVKQIAESRPDTVKAKSAASALSSTRLPSVASKQTTSSRLKMNKPVSSKPASAALNHGATSLFKPRSVSKNTIGFPKARQAPSIIPSRTNLYQQYSEDEDTLADELSDFDFFPTVQDDDEEVFQLPVPE